MKILKYIFLLILLASIGITVFVATQKSDFSIKQSVVINVPKPIIFNYVNDYKNWEDWFLDKKNDAELQLQYSEISLGKGAHLAWSGSNGDGKMETLFVLPNDSIAQKVISNGNEYLSSIKFKDTLNGTKVTWIAKGSVDFMTKINATISGGIGNLMNIFFEHNLASLNKAISKEINSFDIKVQGIVEQPGQFYIKQTYKCLNTDLNAKLYITVPRIINFFKNNKMVMNGKPFMIYQNISGDSIIFSVCGPLKEEIYVTPGSDVSIGFLEPYNALKTTLIGDYSHRNSARKKAFDYIRQNNIELNPAAKEIEVFSKSASDLKHPSQWQTEILIPVKSSLIVTVPVEPSTPEEVLE